MKNLGGMITGMVCFTQRKQTMGTHDPFLQVSAGASRSRWGSIFQSFSRKDMKNWFKLQENRDQLTLWVKNPNGKIAVKQ